MATRNTGPSYFLSFIALKFSKYSFFDKKGIAITEAVIFCKNLRREFIFFNLLMIGTFKKMEFPERHIYSFPFHIVKIKNDEKIIPHF
jgi:hypothetical protein